MEVRIFWFFFIFKCLITFLLRTIGSAGISTFVKATDFNSFKTMYGQDYTFRTCGLGAINNKGTLSNKQLLCVDMDITDAKTCKTNLTPADGTPADAPVFPDDGTTICLSSGDDKNVCPGDYGGKKHLI